MMISIKKIIRNILIIGITIAMMLVIVACDSVVSENTVPPKSEDDSSISIIVPDSDENDDIIKEEESDDSSIDSVENYTATFISNGGTEVNVINDLKYSEKIECPATPVKGGYKFIGWYKDQECKDKWSFSDDTVTENVVLYAGWKSYDYLNYTPTKISEFDFSTENLDFIYTKGTAENELIFSRIISGEYNYRNYFSWFASNDEYIYRYNEELFKCTKAVIECGEFSESLRAKYYGFFVKNSTSPFLAGGAKNGTSYQIYFDNDWKIVNVTQATQYRLIGSNFDNWFISLIGYTLGQEKDYGYRGEHIQLTNHYKPLYDELGKYSGLYLYFSNLTSKIDMGNDKTILCSVNASYYLEEDTISVWNGQKQIHESITRLSECKVSVDFNNEYSGGYGGMFDEILLFTQENIAWDLEKVWTAFKIEALSLSLDLYPTNENKVYII